MRKFLLKILLSATAVLALGGFVAPIAAIADEGVEAPEISVESTDSDIVSSEEETAENDGEEVLVDEEVLEDEGNEAIVGDGEEIVEETESSEWFDEYIVPMIMEYGADVVAFATVAFIALKDTQKTKNALFGALTEITTSNTENKSTAEAVQKLKEAWVEEANAMREEHAEEIAALKEAFLEAITAIREGMETKVDDIDEIVHKVLDVEKIAYGNNAHLVSSGTAKRIAEVIGNGKKTDNKE